MLRTLSALLLAAVLGFTLAGPLQAAELPVVTGKEWKNASHGEKMSYLLGMATIIELEKEYQGDEPQEGSLNHKLVKGLKDDTLSGIKKTVDTYYNTHPNQMERPVVNVIWYELVAPDIQEAK